MVTPAKQFYPQSIVPMNALPNFVKSFGEKIAIEKSNASKCHIILVIPTVYMYCMCELCMTIFMSMICYIIS